MRESAVDLREFNGSREDYQALASLENLIWPDYMLTVEKLKHSHASRPRDIYWHDWLAEEDDRIVGTAFYGQTFWALQPGKFHVYVAVDPAYRNRGLGTALYDHCISRLRQEQDLRYLTCGTREDQEQSIHFLEKRGFVRGLREPVSELEVAAFEEAPFVSRLAQTQAHGIVIRSLQDLARDCPDWQERHWQLHNVIMDDVPSRDPFTHQPLAEYCRRVFEAPNFRMDAHWIAIQDDEWVGITELWITPEDRHKAFTGLTGVKRNARRKGVATALKLHAIRYARTHGFRTIVTDNEENNPMFQINLALGFKAKPAWLDFRKTFRDERE